MKKYLIVILLVLSSIMMMVGCDNSKIQEVLDDNETVTYVSFRINPEIEVLLNESEEVVDANAINEDGETVLENLELEGKTIEEAAKEFVEEAIEQGFYNEEDGRDTLYVDTIDNDGTVDESIVTKVTRAVGNYFSNKGINGKVSEETINKYSSEALEWGVSNGKMKMIMRALDKDPSLTPADLINEDVNELISFLHEKNNEIKNNTKTEKKEYRTSLKELKEEYADVIEDNEKIEKLELQIKEYDEATAEIALEELNQQLENLKSQFDISRYQEFLTSLNELKETYHIGNNSNKESQNKKVKNK